MNSKFKIQNSKFKVLLFWLGGALILGLGYLGVSAWGFGYGGFPLDDAWIHQTYARNLARSGQLAFTPGLPSAGSTAPLWSFLLSLGYRLGWPFNFWTYGLGILFLGLTGWTMARLGARLFPESYGGGRWAGLLCLGEWHLVWAAVSGMETILFVWLSLFLVERYLAHRPIGPSANNHSLFADFGLGLLGGLLILTRPEGIGLVGLIGLDMAYRRWQERPANSLIMPLLRRWLWVITGVAMLVIPYLGFHLWATGRPFPNTFYAKQAEYQVILSSFSLWQRLWGGGGQPVESVQGVFRVIFIGPQVLLLPGLFWTAWLTFKERRTDLLLIWLWWIGFLLLYGLRLPVTYQHGRYQIPAIPWVILLGGWGTFRLLNRLPHRYLLPRVLGRAAMLTLPLLTVAFLVIGALAYGRDVRFIESEMVATARWLAVSTPPETLIAAHDIGAIGYFTQRPLIDLAGLISPEVIPVIRNESALLELILARRVNYLVTFPSWYPEMTRHLTPIHQTEAPWTLGAGGDNMTVYQIE